jgi:hypothetical protein
MLFDHNQPEEKRINFQASTPVFFFFLETDAGIAEHNNAAPSVLHHKHKTKQHERERKRYNIVC